MRIDMTHDVIVPVAVTVGHIGLREWDNRRKAAGATFMYEPAAGIVGMVGGLAMQQMGFAPMIGNSLALCSAVSGLSSVYDWVRAAVVKPTAQASRVAARRMGASGPVINPLADYEKSGI